MAKKGGSAPEPTDPRETAAAQTGTNIGSAIANSYLNNVNQVTPDGTLTYYYGDYNGTGGSTSAPAALPEIETIKGSSSSGLADLMGGSGSIFDVFAGGSSSGDTYRVNGQTFSSMADAEAYRSGLSGGSGGSQAGYYNYTDPYTGKTYQIPQVTAVQTLSEMQQAIKDQSDNAELNLATLANDQSAFLNDYMATPFSYDPGAHEGWALNLYEQLNGDSLAQQQEGLRNQLANQGIKVGTPAYARAMESLGTSQGNARNQFLLDSYNTGMQTALAERNQPINEITALLSGSQVSQPSFVSSAQSNIPTTDVASIIGNADAAAQSAYQNSQANQGGFLSSLGGLFQGLGSAGIIGGSGSGAMLALSDERAKTDKHKIAETGDGMGLYSFKYKGDDRTQVGLMAQEVEKVKPSAVKTMRNGLKMVDYGKALS